jgi:hypothetical protein
MGAATTLGNAAAQAGASSLVQMAAAIVNRRSVSSIEASLLGEPIRHAKLFMTARSPAMH